MTRLSRQQCPVNVPEVLPWCWQESGMWQRSGKCNQLVTGLPSEMGVNPSEGYARARARFGSDLVFALVVIFPVCRRLA